MSRYDMSEADRAWLQAELRTAFRPLMDELKEIRTLLEDKQKEDKEKPATFAYAYASSQKGTLLANRIEHQEEIAKRLEAMELYDGAAIKKEDDNGSEEVVGSGKAC